MGDKYQAGRYFFFSISELEEYQRESVQIFLDRHSPNGFKGVLANAPKTKFENLSELPAYSRETLRRLGAPETLKNVTSNRSQWFVGIGRLLMIAAVIGLAIIGLITVVSWFS